MKEIRIFVASSKELNYARNAISFFAISHDHEFEKKGVRIRLSKWEYVDPSMTKARTEDRYLDEMYNSDAVIVLFKNIIGKYTKEEWQNAIDVESQGEKRLKAHRLLFSEEQGIIPTPELQSFRSSLPPNSYGVFSNLEDLEKEFLSLIDTW